MPRSVFSRSMAKFATGALIALNAVAAAGFAATSPGCSSTTATKYATACANGAATCQVRLTLLHTADVHSRLLPYDLMMTQIDSDLGLGPLGTMQNVGGIARMSYVLKRERARADRVLHLSGGDCFQGAPIFNFFNGEPEMRGQSYLGVDAMAIANHEFDKGPLNVAVQAQKWANFTVLAANYKFDDPRRPEDTLVGSVVRPFTVFNLEGLKVAVIGMGNLSSLTSIFEQPNKLGITPLNTVEAAQGYIDLVRPYVDVVVFTTHLGLEVDQRMIRNTTGIDVVLGSHNHIVINPPQTIQDCNADPKNPGYVWMVDPNLSIDPSKPAPNDADHPDPANHPWERKRACKPRNVVLAHSGAFAKYVGRLDLILSNDPQEITPTGDPADYDPNNRFEVVSTKYVPFPISASTPEDPRVVEMLQPYRRVLDTVADLDILIGYSPNGAKRFGAQGGDSPMGNMVGTSIWLRLGVQTDFSLTNSTGIRQDLLPGPISVEQMYNVFPFDNSITKMQLSGVEVEEMFDFVARRSAGRGCASQAQIAGARVRINCAGCNRADASVACQTDADCPSAQPGACDLTTNKCTITACAEQIYIGHTRTPCKADADCVAANPVPCGATADCPSGYECAGGAQGICMLPGACEMAAEAKSGTCLSLINKTNVYELATSNYLAGGGSGYKMLQRNTTQLDTKIQQRDALIDFMRQGRPCGWRDVKDPQNQAVLALLGSDGLTLCSGDADCASLGDYVCSCLGNNTAQTTGPGTFVCQTAGTCGSGGRCVRSDCRDQVAQFHARRCQSAPDQEACQTHHSVCDLGGESCKILACVDDKLGAITDNRIQMVGR